MNDNMLNGKLTFTRKLLDLMNALSVRKSIDVGKVICNALVLYKYLLAEVDKGNEISITKDNEIIKDVEI